MSSFGITQGWLYTQEKKSITCMELLPNGNEESPARKEIKLIFKKKKIH